MSSRVLTLILAVALVFGVLALGPRLAALRLPGNNQGFEPQQPIAFSHRLHAGELQIACVYCHSGAERSRSAGIPAASTCMNCHRFVTAPRSAVRAEEKLAEKEKRKPRRVISPELAKLYDALALGPDMQRDPRKQPHLIAWARIHRVPDFVAFDHRPHVAAGAACQQCHGPVETMERMRQAENLSMGWCVNCHRTGLPAAAGGRTLVGSTDCASCHY
jgi:hypothetical protein